MNLTKTTVRFFGTSSRLPRVEEADIVRKNTKVEYVQSYKYLGVTLDSRLTFGKPMEAIRQKAFPKIRTLGCIRSFIDKETIVHLYKSLVLSQIE